MKSLYQLILISSLLISVLGCTNEDPLYKGFVSLDSRLIGRWKMVELTGHMDERDGYTTIISSFTYHQTSGMLTHSVSNLLSHDIDYYTYRVSIDFLDAETVKTDISGIINDAESNWHWLNDDKSKIFIQNLDPFYNLTDYEIVEFTSTSLNITSHIRQEHTDHTGNYTSINGSMNFTFEKSED